MFLAPLLLCRHNMFDQLSQSISALRLQQLSEQMCLQHVMQ